MGNISTTTQPKKVGHTVKFPLIVPSLPDPEAENWGGREVDGPGDSKGYCLMEIITMPSTFTEQTGFMYIVMDNYSRKIIGRSYYASTFSI